MKSTKNKALNISIGILLLMFGVVAFAASIYVFIDYENRAEVNKNVMEENFTQCRSSIVDEELTASEQKGSRTITISDPNVRPEQAYLSIMKVYAGVSACQNFRLVEACVGRACEMEGKGFLFFRIQQQGAAN